MAKGKSNYSIQDAYAAQMGEDDEMAESAAEQQSESESLPLAIQGEELAQAEQLKAAGDQSGDYSELGKFVAGLMGGAGAPQAPVM